ncbi:hypothetical protein D9M68_704790 [compost metagenome]
MGIDRAFQAGFGEPGAVHQLGAAEHLFGPSGERLEHQEFGAAELQRQAPAKDAGAFDIDVDQARRCCVDRRGGCAGQHGAAPAKDGLHPRRQFARAEWLQDVIVGTNFQPDHAVDFVRACGQEDDRKVGKTAQCPADIEAVAVWQPDIQDRQVIAPGTQQFQPFGRQQGVPTAHALARQCQCDVLGDGLVVFNEQDGGGHAGLRWSR